MGKSVCSETELVCLECGNVMSIYRKAFKQKIVGHIKTMYCPCCTKVTNFYEVRDVSIFFYKYYGRDQIDKNTKRVLEFLLEREGKDGTKTFGVYQKKLTRK